MLHVPVHFVVFLILLLIIPLKAYTCFIVFALYTYLKEAYIDVKYQYLGNVMMRVFFNFSQFWGKDWKRMSQV